MYFEYYWKDYKRFGPDGSVDLLAKWIMTKLQRDYGSDIQTICITGFCRSLAGPNQNLQSVYERFEGLLSKLREKPVVRYSSKKKLLEIDYATVWPTADEFQPDAQMIKVGTFHRAYLKMISLLELAAANLEAKTDFTFGALISDLKALEPDLPQTLEQLIDLHVACRTKKPT